jgi:hypothetical protein
MHQVPSDSGRSLGRFDIRTFDSSRRKSKKKKTLILLRRKIINESGQSMHCFPHFLGGSNDIRLDVHKPPPSDC